MGATASINQYEASSNPHHQHQHDDEQAGWESKSDPNSDAKLSNVYKIMKSFDDLKEVEERDNNVNPVDINRKNLAIQASAHWHRMIVHANKMKQEYGSSNISQQKSTEQPSLADVETLETKQKSERLLVETESETITNSKPVSRSVSRSPSIQQMGFQFMLEELDKQSKEEGNSSPSPSKHKRKIKRNISNASLAALTHDIMPVQLKLKSRTSSSVTLYWDHEDEVYAQVLQYTENPAYELMYHFLNSGQADFKFNSTVDPDHDEDDSKKKIVLKSGIHFEGRATTVMNLLPDTLYTFRCRRLNCGNFTEWGPVLTVRSGPGPPSSPVNLHAREVSSSSILLCWSPPLKENGLPVQQYILRAKHVGGDFKEVYRGKDKVFLATNLLPNCVWVFEVLACNQAGHGQTSERLAIRTLDEGAPAITPWAEVIDPQTLKIYYYHPKTGATAWKLPEGSLLDSSLSFRNKVAFFQSNIKSRALVALNNIIEDSAIKQEAVPSRVLMNLGRPTLMIDTLRSFTRHARDKLLALPLKISFIGEAGIDGGGISREWAIEMLKKLIDPASGLLTISENGGGVIIDIRSECFHGNDCKWLFTSLGKFFAKVMIDGLITGVQYNNLFLMWISNKEPTLNDLKQLDSTLYSSLSWVLHNDVSDADLTFAASFEIFETKNTVDLIDNGRNVVVTEQNKKLYVDLMINWLIKGRYEPAVTHFLSAFHELIVPSTLKHFTLSELQLLLGGSAEVDFNELRPVCLYSGGYDPESEQVKWFWEIVTELDLDLTGKLLSFITGSSCISPLKGLDPPLTITKASQEGEDKFSLPTAHTCFNQLVLPAYKTKEQLKEKLIFSIMNAGAGFHLT